MYPQVGIVIVSYNAALAVRATLASLCQSKNETPYKLLLIDNASENNERTLIRNAFETHTQEEQLDWQFIQLNKNLGFSGGNNTGIEVFQKDPDITHICLLNSDVIVADYWLDRLVEKSVDVVSAVTNKAESEQCVPTDYHLELSSCIDTTTEKVPSQSFNTINNFTQNWYRAWHNNLVESDVTFFCVLLTKATIDKVGLLDDTFFPGGYEDDDYCFRLHAAGIKIFLARDVFIHHFGSASFGQLQPAYFSKKASGNRQYLEKKHNITWKRRHEKPIVSFTQDIVHMLKGKGNSQLQSYYYPYYLQNLTGVINHFSNEFTAIHNHLVHCNHKIPGDLQAMVQTTLQLGNASESWAAAIAEIDHGIKTNRKWNKPSIQSVEKKMLHVADTIHQIVECNMAMHGFLCDVGVFGGKNSQSSRNLFSKAMHLALKGIPFVWKLKGIVFFAGYPYPEREKDGYFQRVRSIDNLFTDRWRIYIDHYLLPGRDMWYDRPAPKVLVLHMNNHRHMWFMRLLARLFVLRCRTIYFHSVLRMHDGRFGKLMRWAGLTKLIDIHGVVPEEFRYHNDFFSARLYDRYEELGVQKADHIIVVSEAMQRYFNDKYRSLLDNTNMIVLPIFPEVAVQDNSKPYINGKPVTVYAGGTHKWQQIPKMIDAIVATKDICNHRIYCPDPNEIRPLLPHQLLDSSGVIVDSKPFSELLELYKLCHYGFILREDIIVNHAACPTKLVEYIAMGIVPIVDCEEMGDFRKLGMQYIKLKDFIAGHLPDETTRRMMAENNYGVYKQLREMNAAGKHQLQQALRYNKAAAAEESTMKQFAKGLLPKNTWHGKIARRVWWNIKGTNGQAHTNGTAVQGLTVPEALPHLEPCDVLMQVDNFLVGGLENVVLDQIDTLLVSGLRVGLMILGEAGTAAERARKKGVNMCITTFNPDTYRALLAKANPKLVMTHYSFHGAKICHELNIPFTQVIQNTYMWFSDEQAYQFSKAARYTRAFIAVSEYAKDYTVARLGVPEEKCLVIPNSIDLESFKKVSYDREGRALRLKHGFTDQDFVFLSVGSINHQKNHMSSVRAFHMGLKDTPNARLLILGKMYESQLYTEIQEYIETNHLEKHIIYAGESDNPPAYYAMADAFLQTSFFEGGQLSLLEAVVSNLPIVVTEIGFARHFRGIPGVAIAPPPVDIINYNGLIWQLKSTEECDRQIALLMKKTYNERIRPNLPDDIINMLDKHHTYKLYVDLVKYLVKSGEISGYVPKPSWTDIIREKVETSTVSALT